MGVWINHRALGGTFTRLGEILLITLQSRVIFYNVLWRKTSQNSSAVNLRQRHAISQNPALMQWIHKQPPTGTFTMQFRWTCDCTPSRKQKTATFSPSHTFSLRSTLGSMALTFRDKLQLNESLCASLWTHSLSFSLQGCLQWTEKRGHSVQRSDDWAADTGKKEADRGRNKERERCRSLPNCQWVTTVEHTHR